MRALRSEFESLLFLGAHESYIRSDHSRFSFSEASVTSRVTSSMLPGPAKVY